MLLHARHAAWESAKKETENVKRAVLEDVRSRMTLYGTMLDAAASVLSGPEALAMNAEVTSRLLEGMARDYNIAGVIITLDKNGNSIVDSAHRSKRTDNFSDRPYFLVHRDRPDVGLYVSAPYRSRLRNGDPSIALSRRISDSEGRFAGVVVAALRLEHFRELFSRMDLGADSAISLLNRDGIVLMRQPSSDGSGDVGRDISASRAFQQIKSGAPEQVISISPLDGVERFVSFGHVPGFPLLVTAASSTRTILQGWWQQAIVIGGISVPMCGAIILMAMLLQRKVDQLELAQSSLAMLAATDGLTGLANRREFDIAIHREWHRAARDKTSLALLIVDADHFKQVNDRLGHAEGDEVLKRLANLIRASLKRAGDLASRYGGEEFTVLLPTTDASGALQVAESIRSAVETWRMEAKRNGGVGVTVSVGVASVKPGPETQLDQLIAAADGALYQAKAAGRNKCVVAELERGSDGVVVAFMPKVRAR
jgi:diguanylate cyclase (GGDEF)-like protein